MTYLLLNLAFLGTVALVALSSWLARRMPNWRLVALTAIPLLVLTVVFDNVLVGTRIVSYDAKLISGAFLGVAPIEDFGYVIAAAVLLPCLWSLLTPPAVSAVPRAVSTASPEQLANTSAGARDTPTVDSELRRNDRDRPS